jgi:hypothetical protein
VECFRANRNGLSLVRAFRDALRRQWLISSSSRSIGSKKSLSHRRLKASYRFLGLRLDENYDFELESDQLHEVTGLNKAV